MSHVLLADIAEAAQKAMGNSNPHPRRWTKRPRSRWHSAMSIQLVGRKRGPGSRGPGQGQVKVLRGLTSEKQSTPLPGPRCCDALSTWRATLCAVCPRLRCLRWRYSPTVSPIDAPHDDVFCRFLGTPAYLFAPVRHATSTVALSWLALHTTLPLLVDRATNNDCTLHSTLTTLLLP